MYGLFFKKANVYRKKLRKKRLKGILRHSWGIAAAMGIFGHTWGVSLQSSVIHCVEGLWVMGLSVNCKP